MYNPGCWAIADVSFAFFRVFRVFRVQSSSLMAGATGGDPLPVPVT
jgi:hypothetical protein